MEFAHFIHGYTLDNLHCMDRLRLRSCPKLSWLVAVLNPAYENELIFEHVNYYYCYVNPTCRL